jgi:hypothetical protein
LDLVSLDDVTPLKKKSRKRNRVKNIVKDDTIRLSAATMRTWLSSDRGTCIQRPLLQKKSRQVSSAIFGLPIQSSELLEMFSDLLTVEEHAYSELSSESAAIGSRVSSIEQGRYDEEVIPMEMEWEGSNSRLSSIEARFSDARLASLSPGPPGRTSFFSPYHNDEEEQFQLPIAEPQVEVEESDIRTFKLKMVMRQAFQTAAEETLSFNQLTASVRSQRALAGTFYHTLLLASSGQLKCTQDEPYGDIQMVKTTLF